MSTFMSSRFVLNINKKKLDVQKFSSLIGPCPPCPKTVKTNCHCGKQGPKPQRCSNKYWSCNAKCDKPLVCNKHHCEEICHPGDCPPCREESVQKCKCGAKQRKQPCTTPVWQCEKVQHFNT